MNRHDMRILVVEADNQLRNEIQRYLASRACWHTDGAVSIQELESRFRHVAYHAVVTGSVLPDGSGQEVIQRVSRVHPAAFCVYMMDPAEAPLLQASPIRDGFLVLEKPFKLSDLVLLISSAAGVVAKKSNFPIILKKQEGRWVLAGGPCGGEITVTETEKSVAEILLEAPGVPVCREEMFRRIYHREMMPGDRSVDVYIGKLRKKLSGLAAGEYVIRNARGLGYAITGSGD